MLEPAFHLPFQLAKSESILAWYNLAMADENKTDIKRGEGGLFVTGTAPGPGKPQGSVSIVGKIKQKFEENPEYFDEWTDKLLEDPSNREAVMEQIDGKPKQAMDITSGGQPIVAGFNFIKNGDDNTDNPTNV
jgi:hypothetical protein